MRKFDIVVVGAGFAGASPVYHLAKLGFTGSILAADGASPLRWSASDSAGGFRNLFTSDINVKISNLGMKILSRFKEDMGMSVGFVRNGYLFTYYEDVWKQIDKVAGILTEEKVRFELLTPAQLEAKIPGMRCGVDHIDPEPANSWSWSPSPAACTAPTAAPSIPARRRWDSSSGR